VHTTQDVKDLAASLNIELIYIPPGMTDMCQPLDRTIFGVLKAKAKKLFREQFAAMDKVQVRKREACRLIQQCWDEVTVPAMVQAWIIYDPPAE
jgi:hypothetical protein